MAWAQVINTALGVWLIVAPAVLGYGDPARTNDRIVGPLVAAFAYVAISQVTRPVRWVNVLLGAWLLAAPWVLGYDGAARVDDMVVGLLVLILAPVRGPLTARFGGGWMALFR